jgi:hypothetical protein
MLRESENRPNFTAYRNMDLRVSLTELYLGPCSYCAVNIRRFGYKIRRFGYKIRQLITLHVTIIPIFDNQTQHLCR